MENSVKPRILYIDYINVFSCISVVILHCNGYVHSFSYEDNAWIVALCAEVLFYSAVPLFFMISGSTLLSYNQNGSILEFYKKRYRKTFIPYLFWSFFFFLVSYLLYLKTGNEKVDDYSIHYFLCSILTGHIPFTVYWFFIPLFLVYLFIPFVRSAIYNLKIDYILYYLLLAFLYEGIVMPLLSCFDLELTTKMPLNGYIFYCILGFYLKNCDLEKNKRILVVFVVLSVVVCICRFMCIFSVRKYNPWLFSYFGVYASIPSVAIYLLFKRFCDKAHRIDSLIQSLSKYSFGVFLLHIPFVKLFPTANNSLVKLLFGWIFVYFLCVAFVFLIKKCRMLQWLCP